jgi:hypothetical protein
VIRNRHSSSSTSSWKYVTIACVQTDLCASKQEKEKLKNVSRRADVCLCSPSIDFSRCQNICAGLLIFLSFLSRPRPKWFAHSTLMIAKLWPVSSTCSAINRRQRRRRRNNRRWRKIQFQQRILSVNLHVCLPQTLFTFKSSRIIHTLLRSSRSLACLFWDSTQLRNFFLPLEEILHVCVYITAACLLIPPLHCARLPVIVARSLSLFYYFGTEENVFL